MKIFIVLLISFALSLSASESKMMFIARQRSFSTDIVANQTNYFGTLHSRNMENTYSKLVQKLSLVFTMMQEKEEQLRFLKSRNGELRDQLELSYLDVSISET